MFDLALGHAMQSLDLNNTKRVLCITDLMNQVEYSSPLDGEHAFLSTYYTLARQTVSANFLGKIVFTPSASYALDLIGRYLRKMNLSLGLVEPCFSHTAFLCRRNGIRLMPLPEQDMQTDLYVNHIAELAGNALLLTIPNNPTGQMFNEQFIYDIAARCAHYGVTLIIDAAYRFFDRKPCDMYQLISRSGASFIIVEDTGKTWYAYGVKIGFVAGSSGVLAHLRDIQDELSLHPAQLEINLLQTILSDTLARGFEAQLWPVVDANRQRLLALIDDYPITSHTCSAISAEWLKIEDSGISGSTLATLCARSGVHILPGTFFFWNSPNLGEYFFRVALLRSEKYFATALAHLKQVFDYTFLKRPPINTHISIEHVLTNEILVKA